MANIPFLNNTSFSAAITVANSATASNFIATTDTGININGITLTRIPVNSAIRVSQGLETLGLLRSYAGINVAQTATFGGNATFAGKITVNGNGIDIDNDDDVRLRFDNAGAFKAGLQVATTAGDMIAESAVNDFAIRAQGNMLFASGGNTERLKLDTSGNATFAGQVQTGTDLIVGGGDISLVGTGRIQGVDIVSASTDAANKAYVDAHGGGLGPFLPLTAGSSKPLTGDLYMSGSSTYIVGGDSEILVGQDAGGYYLFTGFSPTVSKPLYIGDNASFISINAGGSTRIRINGSNGNVGIGTTGPTEKLDISGTAIVRSTLFTVGNVHGFNPSFGASFFINNNGGTSYFNATGGNVGIGTTTPDTKLNIVGTTDTELRIKGIANTTNSGASVGLFESADGKNGGRLRYDGGTNTLNLLAVDGTATERLGIAIARDTGNVGIGTVSPSQSLEVHSTIKIGETGVTGGRLISGDSMIFQIDSDASSTSSSYRFRCDGTADDGTELMRIQENGRVGIGTTNPGAKLDIHTPTNSNGLLIREDTDDSITHNLYIDTADNGVGVLYANGQSAKIQLNTAGDSYFIGGNVGIGTTGPDSKLDVTGGDITINTAATGFMNFKYGSAGSEVSRGTITTDGIDLKINSVADLILLPSGTNKVGVGTTNPSYKFHVSGASIVQAITSSAADVSMVFINTTSTNYIEFFNGEYNLYQAGGSASNVTLKITNAGAVRFPKYSGTLQTGTPTYILGTDASGNVVKVLGGDIPGVSGQFLPLTGGTMTGNTKHNDDVFSYWGNSDDLSIQHNNSGQFAQMKNITGDLYFTNTADDKDIIFQADNSTNGTETYLTFDGSNRSIVVTAALGVYHNDGVASRFGDAGDLQIYHNGTNSFIDESGTGNLFIRSNTIQIRKYTGEDMITCLQDNAVTLYFDNSPKLATSSTGVTVTGNIIVGDSHFIGDDSFDNLVIQAGGTGNLENLVLSASNDLIFYTGGTTPSALGTERLRIYNSDGRAQFSGDIALGDNDKIRVGASSDIQIYHDGTQSYIDNITNDLYIRSLSDDIVIQAADDIFIYTKGGEDAIIARGDGVVELYYDNTKKLSTGSVSVGTATTIGGTLIDGWKTTTQANAINDTTIATTAYVNNKIGLIPAGLVFQGTWNAATNTPTLTSGSGTTGHFYIVSVAGSTNLDGITDWKVGDWAVFIEQGASDQWEKIDNSSVLDGFGTGQSVTKWDGSGTSNTLTNGPITFSGNDSTFAGSIDVNGTASEIFITGGSMNFKDSNDYIRISKASSSAQIGLFRTGSSAGGMYIGGNSTGFRIFTESFAQKFLLDQSGNATFSGSVTATGDIIASGQASPTISIASNTAGTGKTYSLISRFDGGTLRFAMVAQTLY